MVQNIPICLYTPLYINIIIMKISKTKKKKIIIPYQIFKSNINKEQFLKFSLYKRQQTFPKHKNTFTLCIENANTDPFHIKKQIRSKIHSTDNKNLNSNSRLSINKIVPQYFKQYDFFNPRKKSSFFNKQNQKLLILKQRASNLPNSQSTKIQIQRTSSKIKKLSQLEQPKTQRFFYQLKSFKPLKKIKCNYKRHFYSKTTFPKQSAEGIQQQNLIAPWIISNQEPFLFK